MNFKFLVDISPLHFNNKIAQYNRIIIPSFPPDGIIHPTSNINIWCRSLACARHAADYRTKTIYYLISELGTPHGQMFTDCSQSVLGFENFITSAASVRAAHMCSVVLQWMLFNYLSWVGFQLTSNFKVQQIS